VLVSAISIAVLLVLKFRFRTVPGALVVAVFGGGISPALSMAAALAALAATAVTVRRPLVEAVLRRVAPGADLTHIPRAPVVLFGVAANLAAWMGYGVAFWLFARGSLPQAAPALGESIGAYTASYVAGAIAPFAPGGLGVREGVLVMALREHSGLAAALALSVLLSLALLAALAWALR